jgi:anti-sigma regulatory factor (Ser/Thr protein kinase)
MSDASRERLAAHPTSVGAARRMVRAATARAVPLELTETAELLVSELVTNAVVHAGTPVEIAVAVLDDLTVMVTVSDGSAHAPVTRDYAATASTGRGLVLVQELADRWGVQVTPAGKSVWFCLSPTPRHGVSAPESASSVPEGGAAADTVMVELRGVPLELHAAWQEHAAALLRDYLLLSLEEEETDQVMTHAACSDAVSLLDEAIPHPAEDPPGDPGDAAAGPAPVWLTVPKESVDHFRVLDTTLDRAVALAYSDETLTPPTDPAMQRFRRWVCSEVLAQSLGRPATPWDEAGGDVPA